MGRFLTAATTNADNQNPHLQAGSPKQMEHGQARACYAMLSRNTSSSPVWAGAVFYDKFFQPVRPASHDYGSASPFPANNYFIQDSILQRPAQIFYNTEGTETTPSSKATTNYLNATNAGGEFGNALVDAYSNSTLSSTISRSDSWSNKHYANAMAVNSNHSDKSIVYILNGSTFRAVSRIDGDYSYNRRGTSHFSISGVNNTMWGSASYNNKRKELIILSYVSPNGVFKLITYKGIDFDLHPSPHAAFTAAGVTRTEIASFTLGSNWGVNDTESHYNVKPVLTDNGTIFTTVMFSSIRFSIFRTVRADDAASITSSTHQTQYGLTTSYGREQGALYGQRAISSRDGDAVIAFCPYYYYGSGIYSYIIDRKNNTYYQPTFMNSTSNSFGCIPVPYGDDGFAVFFCDNGYSVNSTGNYISGLCGRNGAGVFEQSGTRIFMPYHTGPNTTNYPGFTQVVDYSMLTNQNVI